MLQCGKINRRKARDPTALGLPGGDKPTESGAFLPGSGLAVRLASA